MKKTDYITKENSTAIIILNWNNPEDTIECLESLITTSSRYEIFILDNGSKDDSVEKLNSWFHNKKLPFNTYRNIGERIDPIDKLRKGKKFSIVLSDDNLGFTGGNNIIMHWLLDKYDYFLLLNNDTVVPKGSLDQLLTTMENKKVGICGPKIIDYHTKKVQSCGYHINMVTGQFGYKNHKYKQRTELDYVSGACLLVRTSLLKRIGLLPKEFFLYFEETDLCTRSKRAGFKVVVNTKSIIYHKESATSNKVKPMKIFYMNRNHLWYMRTYANFFEKITFSVYYSLVRLPHLVIECIINKVPIKVLLKSINHGLFRNR